MKKNAEQIVKALQAKGFEAYFAGGSVRDLLLGQDPKDIDIATNANPDQIQEVFPDNIALGRQFGVILVKSGGNNFEVATFREEGVYLDKRRPSEVRFSSAKADALRRDFTVNGLFYDPIKGKIIDYVSGQEDIKKRVIRFIGDAQARVSEDHLRLIRAIRFKITLNFQYANGTFEVIRANSGLVKNVSAERIRDELNKILLSDRRHIGFTELTESGIFGHIIPEIPKMKGVPQPIEYHHEGDVYTHIYLALKSLAKEAPLHLIWAVILHDIAKPNTLIRENGRIIFHNHAEVSAELSREILKRLKFSSLEIKTISYLVENHMKIAQTDKMRPNKRLQFLLDPRFPDLISLCEADSKGTYPINLDLVEKLKSEVEKAKKEREEFQNTKIVKKLFTGDDLITLGFTPGPKFKEILEEVNDQVISGKIKNKAEAKKFIESRFK